MKSKISQSIDNNIIQILEDLFSSIKANYFEPEIVNNQEMIDHLKKITDNLEEKDFPKENGGN